jgi:hypothetical protein
VCLPLCGQTLVLEAARRDFGASQGAFDHTLAFSVQLTGYKNALHAVDRKKVSSNLAKQVHRNMIEQISKSIQAIDQEIRRLEEVSR